ncbi:hypothetical protein ASD62_04810 [Phycicoccus sp. Root563]|uniref:hypothetical protein n=1 Tax=unclassified Phycicoccus TaxID=2637926 RepID=UPI000702591C|nr:MULTISPECIES: hypothetical protein [unclassified Phycicoccus]KQU70438.1 hypothetical protein ASC58_01035 [Phycicoccus sp. Root101]KQZ88727.1 hypothetical protein ASD62_04810 [Phycicoccus sp. Root563]
MSSSAAAVLGPVAGDPAGVRGIAATLSAEGEQLAALARTARGLADPGVAVWSSPAGAAFGRRFGAVPEVLERVARRYAVAASALRRLADELERVQVEVAGAQRVHRVEWDAFLRAGELMGVAEGSADPAQRAQAGRYRAEMVTHGERVQVAVRRHAEAHDAWTAADRRCAAVLRGLLDDGLADSGLYDALTGTSRVAGEVAGAAGTLALVPPLRPLAAVAAGSAGLQVAADAVVLVGYGDGDPTHLALATAAAVLGSTGSVLKTGARATNAAVVGATGSRSGRSALRLTARDRLAAGLAENVPSARLGVSGARGAGFAGERLARKGVRLVEAPAPRAPLPWTRPPRSAAALRPWLHEQAAVRAATWAKVRWVDDLTAVARAEGASTSWHVAGVAADGVARGVHQGDAVRERLLDAREQADLRDSGTRHR